MLVLCKFLRLLVQTLTDDEKYLVLYTENLTQPIQMLLTQKQKSFSHFSYPILKSTLNFAHFQKKTTVIADVFPKLPSPKKVSR